MLMLHYFKCLQRSNNNSVSINNFFFRWAVKYLLILRVFEIHFHDFVLRVSIEQIDSRSIYVLKTNDKIT